MAKRTVVLVLWLAVAVALCRGWGDEDTEDNTKEPWTVNGAFGKLNDGFEYAQEGARGVGQKMMDNAGDAASKSTETINSAASKSSKYASQQFGEAANLAYEKAGDAKNYASEMADETMRRASGKAGDAKETVAGAMAYGKDKAADAYGEAKQKLNMGETMDSGENKAYDAFDEAKQKVGERYAAAEESMTEQDKTNYEVAKEKASQAAGDAGAKMRRGSAEL